MTSSLRLFLALLLFPAAGFPLSRIWEISLIRPMEFLAFGGDRAGETSMIPHPGAFRDSRNDGDWTALYQGGLSWTGLARMEAETFHEAAGSREDHAIWIRPIRETDLRVVWSERMERNRYTDPGRLDFRLGETRRSLGLDWVQHVLPGEGGAPFLDFSVSLPDLDRRAFAWTLAGGRRGAWSLEYSLAHGDIVEDVVVENLDPKGEGEIIRGLYKARTATHRVAATAPLAGGRLGLSAAYGEGIPDRPDGEFWFTDSTRRVDAAAGFSRPFAIGEWRARAAFRESQVITLGRRIPPGSVGQKRFHYAGNEALFWQLEAERAPASPASGFPGPGVFGEAEGLRMGIAYRDYAWKSNPAADALASRDETLSYNRLGLSFIANLYGGLFKESEVISGSVSAGAWEAKVDWLERFGGVRSPIGGSGASGSRFGTLEASAGVSLHRTGFRLEYQGHTLSQRVFTVDTSAAYGRDLRGYVAGATPRLALGWALGGFRIEIEAAQAIPLVVDVQEPGEAPGQGSAGKSGRYPPFRNGFAARLGVQAGY